MNVLVRNAALAAGLGLSAAAGAQNAPGGCSARLYDNGTFVTAASGGGDGSSPVSTLTSPDTVYGSNSNNQVSISVAENFVVPIDWTVTELTFYAYQTSSPITSTITGVPRLSLWNGAPGAGGTLLAGPTAATLVSTTWTGVFRVLSTSPTNTLRPIMEVNVQWPASFPVVLTPGTYWLEWAETGTLASGPWTPPRNASATDDARQNNFTGGTDNWTAIMDGTRPLGLPFAICGISDLLFRNNFE